MEISFYFAYYYCTVEAQQGGINSINQTIWFLSGADDMGEMWQPGVSGGG